MLDVSNTTTFNPVLVAGSGGGTTNSPPVASFTYNCTGLSCVFTDTSTDGDGTIVSRSWSFGDGGTSDAPNPSHGYSDPGTYPVNLTVTDDDGATATFSQNVTVTSAPPPAIALTVTSRTMKSGRYADLRWTDVASADSVDVYRNGVVVVVTPDDGAYTDKVPKTLSSATYKVCGAGTTTCSNEVTVTW